MDCTVPSKVIGIDLGDIWSHLCVLDEAGEVVDASRIRTTREAFESRFGGGSACRVILEVGAHSPWVSRTLTELGHDAIVANPRRVKLIANADRKTDSIDAETLARLGRVDPNLLAPIEHGGEAFQRDRALLTMRQGAVRNRVRLILQLRGMAKALGTRLPDCDTAAFAKKVREAGMGDLWPGMGIALTLIESLTEAIREFNREVERACKERHPVTLRLRQVPGVGPITALAFVLKVEDPDRFAKSREVGPFLSLVPRVRSSGTIQPQLGIPRRGDAMVRRCLVQAAQHILGPFGPDTDLRRFGLAKIEADGKRRKKRVMIAVARKLAVLLHQLWVSGEDYEPLRNSTHREAKAA